MGEAKAFKSGREFAAWLGLVPRHIGSGRKIKLHGISKRVKDFGRIFERTGLGKEEGEKALKRFHTLVQQAMDKGQRAADGVMTFRDAAARFLKEATKRSLDRDI